MLTLPIEEKNNDYRLELLTILCLYNLYIITFNTMNSLKQSQSNLRPIKGYLLDLLVQDPLLMGSLGVPKTLFIGKTVQLYDSST